MTLALTLSLSVIAWAITLSRLRAVHWKDVRQDNGIALNVSLMMVFLSITLLLLNKPFGNFFDALTFNNMDRLVSYSSILTGMYFGALASAEAVGDPSDRKVVQWLRYSLILTIGALVVLYSLFISRIPNMNYYVPRSLPEFFFLLITFTFGVLECAFVDKVYLAYLPAENSPVMRTRAILIIVSTFIACTYFLVKILTVVGYFWPPLASQTLLDLSLMLLGLAALTHFSALLSNKLYVPVILISRIIKGWKSLKDINCMVERLQQLCPEAGLQLSNPSLISYSLNPEYHLYKAIITIMDGKTILDNLLREGALQGEPTLWEGDMLLEAIRVKRALQSIELPGDFWNMVSEYRRASRGLREQYLNLVVEEIR